VNDGLAVGDAAGVAVAVWAGVADGDPRALTGQETNSAASMPQASNIILFT
jgi:hypothetical protein